MRCGFAIGIALLATSAGADEHVTICYNYGCAEQVDVRYTDGELGDVRRMLLAAPDAASEREILALVVGRLYGWAGEQSLVRNDRGGNFDDEGVEGRMDCIDHSTSTTRLLQLLEARGYLRFHRVLGVEARRFAGVVVNHWTAVIEEMKDGEGDRFAVDSWFVDNGQPAVILPLDEWKKGAGPDV